MVGKIDKITAPDDQHTGDATCLLYLDDHVISGGADGHIKIWSKDLRLVRVIADAHESYILALAACPRTGRLYSSSCDGTIRYTDRPISGTSRPQILMRTPYDEITALFCPAEDMTVVAAPDAMNKAVVETSGASVLWSGDDKGSVIKWVGGRIAYKYNIVEEVRSMWVENTLLYTARDLDAVITDVGNSRTGQYVTAGTIAGRAPLTLVGERRAQPAPKYTGLDEWQRHQWLAFTTRDGRGVQMVHNAARYETVWLKADVHDMIINAICGTTKELYTAGWDGHVKQLVELDGKEPLIAGDVSVGCCVNALCAGADGRVYVADTRGLISRVSFSGPAA